MIFTIYPYCLTINIYIYCLYIFQINLPDPVIERWGHSLSTFMMGPHCVWLIIIGGGTNHVHGITDPKMNLVELGMSCTSPTVVSNKLYELYTQLGFHLENWTREAK